jgi:cell division protein ZapA
MAQINVDVNGRPYAVGCEDGQEDHLVELLLADELFDAKNRLAGLQTEVTRLQADRGRIEGKAVSALEAAATRIEKLAAGDA